MGTALGGLDRFIRSEDQTFPIPRCLIVASEFHITVDTKRRRVTLDGGDFFYLSGIWEPAMAESALSNRIVTVPANGEVAPY